MDVTRELLEQLNLESLNLLLSFVDKLLDSQGESNRPNS